MSLFLQADSLAVASQVATEAQPTEQTLSMWSLLTSGGIGGQLIMLVLFIQLFFALFLYFERFKNPASGETKPLWPVPRGAGSVFTVR